ncbi:MAG: hypothetical protein Q4G40_00975, partial [Brachybacterium sp.]|nr:hypothetical protein [Brachybacterium sp.]
PESARIPVHGVLLLPVAWMVGTQASLTLEFGVGSGAGLLAVLVTCAMALASPLLTVLASRRLRLVHGLLLPAAAVLAIAGLVLAGTAVSQAIGGPRQVSPQAMLDADSDAVTWSYRGEPNGGRAVLDSLTEQVSHANLPPPELEVLEVQQGQGPDGDRRRVTVELTSPRGGTAFLLTPVANAEDGGGDQERIVLADLRIDGEVAIGEVTGAESVRYVGIPAEESVTVEMTIPDEPLDLVLADETYDLSDLGATITTPDGQLFVEPVVYVRTVVTV